jgi:glutathione S-transferase
MIEYLGL